ncbi:MAG: type VII secretion-associated serine protease mycosin, partial [Actinoplanes sp.]
MARRAAGRALLGVAAVLAVTVPAAAPVVAPSTGGQLAGAPVAFAPGDSVARTDQVRDEQWQLDELQAETAWRSSTGRGVTVAVVDSG